MSWRAPEQVIFIPLQKLLDDDELRGRATHLVMRGLYQRYQAKRPDRQPRRVGRRSLHEALLA